MSYGRTLSDYVSFGGNRNYDDSIYLSRHGLTFMGFLFACLKEILVFGGANDVRCGQMMRLGWCGGQEHWCPCPVSLGLF